ncbi:MAG: hypothetical protein ACJ796_14655 [Gemmatimonadaceae bacterium]
MTRTAVSVLIAALLPLPILAAQAPPLEAHRPWIELGLGASREAANCGSCYQKKMGGPAASLSFGATITPRFGFAVLLRKFAEFSFEDSHEANYAIALAQYSPAPGLTLNGGLGYGSQFGDDPPYSDSGSGAVLGGGIALRLPPTSTFGLTLHVDWLKTVSGKARMRSDQPGTSYRPLLFTIGLGLNLAGDAS